LRSHRTHGSSFTLRTFGAHRAGGAGQTNWTLRSDFTLGTLFTLLAGFTLKSLRTLGACIAVLAALGDEVPDQRILFRGFVEAFFSDAHVGGAVVLDEIVLEVDRGCGP
jgi:hypothetical protein